MDAFKERFADAVNGQVSDVHQARVASRRLREALRVASVVAPRHSRGVRRDMRRVTRALGQVREMHVTLALLAEEASRHRWPPVAVADVRRRLDLECSRRLRRMKTKLHRLNVDQLGKRVRTIAEAAGGVPRLVWTRALVARLRARGADLTTALKNVGGVYVAGQLHGARLAAKKLRYTFELAGEAASVDTRAIVGEMKAAQEALGRLQDLHVLQDHLRSVMARGPAGRVIHAAPISAMLEACDTECRALHAAFLTWSTQLSVDAARATREVAVAIGAGRRMARGRMPAPAKAKNGRDLRARAIA
jgi:CHAD domain-containing protein